MGTGRRIKCCRACFDDRPDGPKAGGRDPRRDSTPADAGASATPHATSWRSPYAGLVPNNALGSQLEGERREKWTAVLAQPHPDQLVLCAASKRAAPHEADFPQRELLGFACAPPDRDRATRALLDNLHVTPARKGGGVGHALMAAMARSLRRTGFRELHLLVIEGNLDAERF